ncbi:MAG: hypothetical protein HC834_04220 [Rhodospirillales bacterium]|nr:hypothetical protein [Rhodospirillales bacterium]
MNETARLIRSLKGNISLLAELRETIRAIFAEIPKSDVEASTACVEQAVIVLIKDCRNWAVSPQRVAVVTELEALSNSFKPGGRLRGIDRLSEEAISALLDEPPGGCGIVAPGILHDRDFHLAKNCADNVAVLTDLTQENALLINRINSTRVSNQDEVSAVGVYLSPSPDPARLRALFAKVDAREQGSLPKLKAMLTKSGRTQGHADRCLIAESAQRAANHLRTAFHMWDKQKHHQRGGTIVNWLEPTPFTKLVVTLANLISPPERGAIFHATSIEAERLRVSVRSLADEAYEGAHAIIENTPELRGLNILCGIYANRITNDLRNTCDQIAEAVRRITNRIMEMFDDLILIEGYLNMLNAYTDRLIDICEAREDPDPGIRLATDVIVGRVCKKLGQWRQELKAELRDGVVYADDVRPRATGNSRYRQSLPQNIRRAATRLGRTLDYGLTAIPQDVAPIHELVDVLALSDDEIRIAWGQVQGVFPIKDFLPQLSSKIMD